MFKSFPRVYFEMFFVGFSLIMGMGLARSFLPIMASEFDPTGALVGFVVSAWFTARIFIELPSGFLSERIGRRRLLVWGLALGCVGSLTCATANSIYLLIIGRAIWGLGAALYFTINTALILGLFDPSVRGRAMGTFQGLQFIGGFVGAPIGALLASSFGFNSVFYVTFVFMLVSFFIAFFSGGLKQVGGRSATMTKALSVREAVMGLKSWGLLVVCTNMFSRMLVMMGVMSTVFQLYLYNYLGISIELISIIISARTVAMIAATLISGHLSDRFGRKPVIIGGLLMGCACLYLYTLELSFETIVLLGIIDGFGGGMVWANLVVFLSELVSLELRGGAVGLYRTFMDLGGILGPPIFMNIYNTINIYATFSIAALLILINVFLIMTVKRKEEGD